jgi:hypothetical protein
MELDELKRTWDSMNRKLDASLTLNGQLVRRSLLTGSGSALQRLGIGNAASLLMNIVLVLIAGSVLADSTESARTFIPALLLHLASIAALAMSIHQRIALHAIDLGESVVSIQKKLERLRSLRLLELQWILISSPLLWILGLLVTARSFLGIDLLRDGPRDWVLANLGFGIAVIVVARWAAGRISMATPRGQRLLDALAGRALHDARQTLQALKEFERER